MNSLDVLKGQKDFCNILLWIYIWLFVLSQCYFTLCLTLCVTSVVSMDIYRHFLRFSYPCKQRSQKSACCQMIGDCCSSVAWRPIKIALCFILWAIIRNSQLFLWRENLELMLVLSASFEQLVSSPTGHMKKRDGTFLPQLQLCVLKHNLRHPCSPWRVWPLSCHLLNRA